MIGEGIQEDVLRALVEQLAVRGYQLAKVDGGPDWSLSIRLGSSDALGASALATWASLTEVGLIADSVGFRGFSVEL